MDEFQKDELKDLLNELTSGKDGKPDIKSMLSMLMALSKMQEEVGTAKKTTETACNVLVMLRLAIKTNGLGKTLEDVDNAISSFPKDLMDKLPEDKLMENWNAMCKCVKMMTESIADGNGRIDTNF